MTARALALALLVAACARAPAKPGLGVTPLNVRLTASHYLVDVRYRVTDAARATALLAPGAKPVLRDDATGAALYVPSFPKVGSLRTQGAPQLGRDYFLLFGNPHGVVHPGSHVTLTLGDAELAHLAVE